MSASGRFSPYNVRNREQEWASPDSPDTDLMSVGPLVLGRAQIA